MAMELSKNASSSSLHAENDRRTPSIWHRHELTWTADHCAMLQILRDGTLAECQSTCLADERCTALNFHSTRPRSCETRNCANGEQPTMRRRGWVGFSSFGTKDGLLASTGKELTDFPAALTIVLLLIVALLLIAVAVHRAFPSALPALRPLFVAKDAGLRKLMSDDESPCSRPHPWSSTRGLQHCVRETELLAVMATPQAGGDDADEPWSPVLTDPLSCSSQHFVSGPVTPQRSPIRQ